MEEKQKEKSIVILLGPPGSGKGTQGTLLAEKLNFYYFETSKILEDAFLSHALEEFVEIKGEKFVFSDEKEKWEKGFLCSPPLAAYLAEKKIRELYKEGKNILLAGSPRTLNESETLIPLLRELYGKENIKIILIEISAEDTIYRNSHRRICELMRHPILYSDETKNLEHCPLDGSKLMRREGLDDPETIKTRLEEYSERTLPLVDFLEKQEMEIKRINGEQTVADVFGDILKVLSDADTQIPPG